MWGGVSKLVSSYRKQRRKMLCQNHSENCYVSCNPGLSLQQYMIAQESDYLERHKQPCSLCNGLLSTADKVLKDGYILLSEAFRSAFPEQT